MRIFSQMRPLVVSGLKIRSKKWTEGYYIYKYEEKLIDSLGNNFYYSWEDFFNLHQEVLNNAGPIWELYEEVGFNNL